MFLCTDKIKKSFWLDLARQKNITYRLLTKRNPIVFDKLLCNTNE